MSDHDPLSSLDERINIRGYIERILTERDRVDEEREKRLNERSQAAKEAVTAALASAEKAVDAAMAAAEKASQKSEEAAAETLKSHNNLIAQSRERDSTYATQTDLSHANEGIKRLESFQAKILGALGIVAILFPLVTALVVYLLTRQAELPVPLPVTTTPP